MRAWKGSLVLSEDKSWLLSPRTARNEVPANVLLHHLTLGEEHIIGLLRKLEWFSVLPERDLKSLYQRGRHRAFPRYSAIIREGASCDALHILLHGQLKFVSASQSTVIKNAGAFFGESALVARAQPMDAAVYAETDCFVLQLSRSDVQGLSVDADFSAFLDIVPTFAVACSESENVYRALEHAVAAYSSDVMPQGSGLAGPLAVVGRWERLARALLRAQLPREAAVKTPDSWLQDPYAGVGW